MSLERYCARCGESHAADSGEFDTDPATGCLRKVCNTCRWYLARKKFDKVVDRLSVPHYYVCTK